MGANPVNGKIVNGSANPILELGILVTIIDTTLFRVVFEDIAWLVSKNY